MKQLFVEETIDYDGSQIHGGWSGRRLGIEGDCIVAFIGACDVAPDEVIDLDEVESGEPIRGTRMLHFIAEQAGTDLHLVHWRQRLFAELARAEVSRRAAREIRRDGDDLYDGELKLSISVATTTEAGTSVFHFAMNTTTAETPVPTQALDDLGIDARDLAVMLLGAYAREAALIDRATTRVRRAAADR